MGWPSAAFRAAADFRGPEGARGGATGAPSSPYFFTRFAYSAGYRPSHWDIILSVTLPTWVGAFAV